MIKKLRKKFIITAFLAVFALVFSILAVINVVNFAIVTADADRVTEMLSRSSGRFEGFDGPQNAPGDRTPPGGFNGGQFGPNSPETGASTRYFTVKILPDGTTETVAYRISIVTEEQAVEWAKSLVDKTVGWSNQSYRYRVWHNGQETYVTVIDYSRELRPTYNVLWASLIGGGVGLIVTFLALLPISRAVVKPIENNDRKQRRFISDAAYELKTPLSVIDTNRKTLELKSGPTLETESIAREVKGLVDFTGKLDTLVTLETAVGKENFREFDLSALLTEILRPYKEVFSEKGKTLQEDVAPGVLLNGDPRQISELLNACLENGLQYADSYLTVSLKQTEGRVNLDFTNDAKSVIDGPLDSVFETFYRSEDVKESGIEGAGIGLSIARSVVSSHNGRIMARGENGCFLLKIEL
ncbi:MAG: hypothetical protein IJ735_04240 [Clostridia bacterium]|nr:hypothetical protein [Clostridia bacterium]